MKYTMKALVIALSISAVVLCSGCSMTLYERKKDASKVTDQGAATEISMTGPVEAAIVHKF